MIDDVTSHYEYATLNRCFFRLLVKVSMKISVCIYFTVVLPMHIPWCEFILKYLTQFSCSRYLDVCLLMHILPSKLGGVLLWNPEFCWWKYGENTRNSFSVINVVISVSSITVFHKSPDCSYRWEQAEEMLKEIPFITISTHDDVIKWKPFPRYCSFEGGNSPVISEFPAQRPVTRNLVCA